MFPVVSRDGAFLPLTPGCRPHCTLNVQVIKYNMMSPTWQPPSNLRSLTSFCYCLSPSPLPSSISPFPLCAAKHLEKSDILEVNRPTAVHQLLSFSPRHLSLPSSLGFSLYFSLLFYTDCVFQSFCPLLSVCFLSVGSSTGNHQ